MNTFGQLFRLTTFGESHGAAIGGVIDGMPACFPLDMAAVQRELDRRRPGQSAMTTARKEPDKVEFLSGISESGLTLGSPIGFIIRNTDAKSKDYSAYRDALRPNHADFTYMKRYGIRDYRGGGRSSARDTANRVVGGAVARQLLESAGINIVAWLSQMGSIKMPEPRMIPSREDIRASIVNCPDPEVSQAMEKHLLSVAAAGDTVGGMVRCVATGVPAGIGDPVFGKLQALLAAAMMGINAAKGFDYGIGMEAAEALGSATADNFAAGFDGPRILSNHSGGIQGGISNGMPLTMRVAFKPTPTLMQEISTTDIAGNPVVLPPAGRHDPCVAIRAVPVVEAMAALTIADAMLRDGYQF